MSELGGKADKYQKLDRVFAKMKGYQPWPAQVQKRSSGKQEKYWLLFYGTHDLADVKSQMMYPYTPDTITKYGKPSKPSQMFKKAMEEIEANVELYVPTEEPQELEEQADESFEEGNIQMDETPPPVLKTKEKITAQKSASEQVC